MNKNDDDDIIINHGLTEKMRTLGVPSLTLYAIPFACVFVGFYTSYSTTIPIAILAMVVLYLMYQKDLTALPVILRALTGVITIYSASKHRKKEYLIETKILICRDQK